MAVSQWVGGCAGGWTMVLVKGQSPYPTVKRKHLKAPPTQTSLRTNDYLDVEIN